MKKIKNKDKNARYIFVTEMFCTGRSFVITIEATEPKEY